MKQELKSGIVEFDLLVEQFENGEINFVELTSALWNKGYDEGKKQAYSQTLVSGMLKSFVSYAESRSISDININDDTIDYFIEDFNLH